VDLHVGKQLSGDLLDYDGVLVGVFPQVPVHRDGFLRPEVPGGPQEVAWCQVQLFPWRIVAKVYEGHVDVPLVPHLGEAPEVPDISTMEEGDPSTLEDVHYGSFRQGVVALDGVDIDIL